MPYGIAQCYLLLSRGNIPAFTPAQLVLDLATTEGCKAELTYHYSIQTSFTFFTHATGGQHYNTA